MASSDEQDTATDATEENTIKSLLERISRNNASEPPSEGEIHWCLTAICLQEEIAKELRKFVDPIIEQVYTKEKLNHKIDTQVHPKFLEKYVSQSKTEVRLNYIKINNNDGQASITNYNYKVTDKVQFSKLFLKGKDSNQTNYLKFDSKCDTSTLLNIILNIPDFHDTRQNLRYSAGQVRVIRNKVAHYNEDEWTDELFSDYFVKFQTFIDSLNLPPKEQCSITCKVLNIHENGKKSLQGRKEEMENILKKLEAIHKSLDTLQIPKKGHTPALKSQLFNVEADSVNPLPPPDEGETDYTQLAQFVKIYPVLKDEMDRDSAKEIANDLFESDHIELIDFEGPRRRGVYQLLKRVLKDHPQHLTEFMKLITKKLTPGCRLKKMIETSRPSLHEVEEVEKHCAESIQRKTTLWVLEPNVQDILEYEIKDRVNIDRLNDLFLSKFLFSIRDHDSVCNSISNSVGEDCKEAATRLLFLMQTYPVTIVHRFFTVMESTKWWPGIKKRNLLQKYCENNEETSQSASPDEEMFSLVASDFASIDTDMKNKLNFKVDNIIKGSIILRLYAESDQSFTELKKRCLAGNIDEIFDVVFSDKDFSFLPGDTHRFLFTIYSQKDAAGRRIAVFKFELIPGEDAQTNEDVRLNKNIIERNHDLFCEELQLCDELIDALRKADVLREADLIEQDLKQESSRSAKISCLLSNISPSDKGYSVIKEYIKSANTYLYHRLEKVEADTIPGTPFFQCEANINRDIPVSDVSRKKYWRVSKPVYYFREEDLSIPVEILRMDNNSIALFKKALEEGKEKDYNIRLMIVGQYGVGKTTLTKRLLNQDVNIEERKSTDGIDVHIRSCKVSLDSNDWIVENADKKSDNTFSSRTASVFGSIELKANKDQTLIGKSESSGSDSIQSDSNHTKPKGVDMSELSTDDNLTRNTVTSNVKKVETERPVLEDEDTKKELQKIETERPVEEDEETKKELQKLEPKRQEDEKAKKELQKLETKRRVQEDEKTKKELQVWFSFRTFQRNILENKNKWVLEQLKSSLVHLSSPDLAKLL